MRLSRPSRRTRLYGPLLLVAALALAAWPEARGAAPTTCHGEVATIVGTDDADTLRGTRGRDVVALGRGDDVFDGLDGDDLICGGPGDDGLTGGDGNDEVDGGSGDDFLQEGAGDDRLVGGPGEDVVSYLPWATGIRVESGSIVTGAGRDEVSGVEVIEGTPHDDVMIGGPGDDGLRGVAGDDVIRGRGGDDRLAGSGGTIYGGGGNDLVEASDTVTADLGPGVNAVRIGAGRVVVQGGRGRDTFHVDTDDTRSTVHGGRGASRNRVTFVGTDRRVRVDLERGVARWNGGRLRFDDVQVVVGSHRQDVILGSRRGDILYGRRGADLIRGRGGVDLLVGQGGRDRVDGGRAFDYCRAEARFRCEA